MRAVARQDMPLYRGLEHWYYAVPATMKGVRWHNLGRAGGYGTVTNAAATPTATSGWTMRYPRLGKAPALALDDANDTVALPAGNILTNGPFTLSWWEYIFSMGVNTCGRWSLTYASGTLNLERTRAVGNRHMIWGLAGGATWIRMNTAPLFDSSVGLWTHFILCCDANPASSTTTDWRLYANGALISLTTIAGVTGSTGNSLGGHTGAPAANAALDDMAVWPTRSLTQAEARQWYYQSRLGHPMMFRHRAPVLSKAIVPPVAPGTAATKMSLLALWMSAAASFPDKGENPPPAASHGSVYYVQYRRRRRG